MVHSDLKKKHDLLKATYPLHNDNFVSRGLPGTNRKIAKRVTLYHRELLKKRPSPGPTFCTESVIQGLISLQDVLISRNRLDNRIMLNCTMISSTTRKLLWGGGWGSDYGSLSKTALRKLRVGKVGLCTRRRLWTPRPLCRLKYVHFMTFNVGTVIG